MFEYIVPFFLIIALILYVVFGGADFGAGIVELFSKPSKRAETEILVYRAIGPIWEANHVWLIVIIVILFVGFPNAYVVLSTYLHIPMFLMLLGIIIRGTTFMFRHYDAIQDEAQLYYSAVFRWSSFITPFFLGLTAGAPLLGRIETNPTDFYSGFVAPWANAFCISMGFFVCAISAYLAAILLIGEAPSSEKGRYIRMALWWNVATVITGGFVFLAAEYNGLPLLEEFIQDWHCLVIAGLATLSLPVLRRAVSRPMPILQRLIAGFQIGCILIAWLWNQYPVLVRLKDGMTITVKDSLAPAATLQTLGIALIVGVMIIIPSLIYLYLIFKSDPHFGYEEGH